MTIPEPSRAPLDGLELVLGSADAVRNGRALFLLLGTFSAAGLLLAMTQMSLARGQLGWAACQAGATALTMFYGGNGVGLMLMDEVCGRPPREVGQALVDALRSAHRLLLVLLVALALAVLLVTLVAALLWVAGSDRLGPWLGPLLFGLGVPLGVVLLGAAMLALVAVVGPLAGPAIWCGLGVAATLSLLGEQLRRRFLAVALLTAAVALLTSAVGALIALAVVGGGRAVAALAVLVAGIDLPPQLLLAGVFGYGPRSLGAVGSPVVQSPHGLAALIGGGVVFALALVLPVLVYLRGVCSVFVALHGTAPRPQGRP